MAAGIEPASKYGGTGVLDLEARHDRVDVFEYACREGNYGLEHMLKVSRTLDKPGSK